MKPDKNKILTEWELNKNTILMCKDCGDKQRQEWQKKNRQTKIRIGDFVKVPVSDINGTEHLWFEIYKKYPLKYIGRCDNTPVVVEKIKYNGLMIIKRKDIEEHILKDEEIK